MFTEGFDKVAKVLTTKARKQISDEDFALSGRRYPIHDLAHAKAALSYGAKDATPEELKTIQSKVYSRYPALKARHEAREGE